MGVHVVRDDRGASRGELRSPITANLRRRSRGSNGPAGAPVVRQVARRTAGHFSAAAGQGDSARRACRRPSLRPTNERSTRLRRRTRSGARIAAGSIRGPRSCSRTRRGRHASEILSTTPQRRRNSGARARDLVEQSEAAQGPGSRPGRWRRGREDEEVDGRLIGIHEATTTYRRAGMKTASASPETAASAPKRIARGPRRTGS